MFKVEYDSNQFFKEMQNIVEYSAGFIEGAQRGKNTFLKNLGSTVTDLVNSYVDSNARVDPAMLHHVYEWEQTGSPNARLFDIDYVVTGAGLSINSTFRQSNSIQNGSNKPFYDKANIMENGIPVVIRPVNSGVLVFNDGDEEVFTRKPVTIAQPGGPEVAGAYEKTFRSFFDNYFTQAFMRSSGLSRYFENPQVFTKNLRSAKRGGRALGVTTGFRWVANAGIEVA